MLLKGIDNDDIKLDANEMLELEQCEYEQFMTDDCYDVDEQSDGEEF